MSATPEHLLLSRFWGIRRPRHPLTPGHFIIRLSDPAMAFGPESAADLLRCYGILRRALTGLEGATAAQLYMSRNWQPVGGAIGEPLAESSTPTLHAFFALPGSTTAAAALLRPAHQRETVACTAVLDAAVRDLAVQDLAQQQESAPRDLAVPQQSAGAGLEAGGPVPATAPASADGAGSPAVPPSPASSAYPWVSGTIFVEAVDAVAGAPFTDGHWRAVPLGNVTSLDLLGTAELLELAAGVEQLAWNSVPRHAGLALWANDVWGSPAAIHIFGRQHGDGGKLADFVAAGGLDLPAGAPNRGKSAVPSPILEK